MVTKSSQEIVPLKRINDQVFQGSDGIVIQKLTELFERYRTKLLSIDEL
jgi:4-amino-4-deoxychorismate lyase